MQHRTDSFLWIPSSGYEKKGVLCGSSRHSHTILSPVLATQNGNSFFQGIEVTRFDSLGVDSDSIFFQLC